MICTFVVAAVMGKKIGKKVVIIIKTTYIYIYASTLHTLKNNHSCKNQMKNFLLQDEYDTRQFWLDKR